MLIDDKPADGINEFDWMTVAKREMVCVVLIGLLQIMKMEGGDKRGLGISASAVLLGSPQRPIVRLVPPFPSFLSFCRSRTRRYLTRAVTYQLYRVSNRIGLIRKALFWQPGFEMCYCATTESGQLGSGPQSKDLEDVCHSRTFWLD